MLTDYISRLVYVNATEAGLTQVDTTNGWNRAAVTTPTTNSCDKAKQLGNDGWSYSYSSPPRPCVYTYSAADNNSPPSYWVYKYAVRAQPYCNPTWAPGALMLYLSATNYDGCSSTGGTNTCPAVTPDGQYHLFWAQAVDGSNTYYGPHIGDCNPTVASDCPCITNNPSGEGWKLGGTSPDVYAIFKPQLNAEADKVPLCGGDDSGGGCSSCRSLGVVAAATGSVDLRVYFDNVRFPG